MTRAGWEFLCTDRPELKLAPWGLLSMQAYLALEPLSTEEVISAATASILAGDFTNKWVGDLASKIDVRRCYGKVKHD